MTSVCSRSSELGKLAGDDVGIGERRMRPLADDDHLVPHAAGGQPRPEQRLAEAAAVDPGGVKDVAPALVKRVADDRRLGEGREIGAAECDHRSVRVETGEPAPAHWTLRLAERPPVDLCRAPFGPLEAAFQAGISLPPL